MTNKSLSALGVASIVSLSAALWLAPAQQRARACSDSVDNDRDGLVDMADPGCRNRNDDDERNEPTQPPAPEPTPTPTPTPEPAPEPAPTPAPDPPPVGGVGPQATIACPAGAVNVAVGASIQGAINASAGATTFCLRTGVHPIAGAITPKTGNTFIGEYGAVLDGTGWATTDVTQAAFRSHNQDIDDVTIRNLVIRNMPQRAIHAYYLSADRWTIEHNEIAYNRTGLQAPNDAVVRANHIHHNVGVTGSAVPNERGGGYLLFRINRALFERNEIAYNGSEQKVVQSASVTFRNNFVHHNVFSGIWYDADNVNGLVESNTVEDHAHAGIFYEISGKGVIRNNTVRRSGDNAIFISTSKDVEITGNVLEDNYRGIQYFLNCGSVGMGTIGFDLANNTAHGNRIVVGTRAGSLANGFSHLSSCTAAQVAPYLSGQKALAFHGNAYVVPNLTTRYWFWGYVQWKTWAEWRALGHDVTGSAVTP